MRPLHHCTALTFAVLALASLSLHAADAAAPSAPAPASAPSEAAPAAAEPAAPAPAEAVFSAEQLEQMLAPIALYPDSLLAQVLMAATYPGNVADAVAWAKAHPDAKGDDAVRQVADQPWDPSVQSLVAFPAVLNLMGQDPAWVQRVGDAFLAQPDAVMQSVQTLRQRAKAAGNLESGPQQKVTVQQAAPSQTTTQVAAPAQTIVIEPADPQVVYVPSYNPTVVYGQWPAPAYPPTYYPPPPEYPVATGLATGLAFGVGVAAVASLWGDCDWGHGDVDIDVNRYNNINVNRRIDASQRTWQHNPAYRQGVPYRGQVNQQRFDRRLAGADQRVALRGQDPRAAERERARQSLSKHGVAAPAANNRQALERAQSASREMRQEPKLRQDNNLRQREQAGNRARERAPDNLKAQRQARERFAGNQGPRNNAFADARNPRQARASSERGQLSRASARSGGGGRMQAAGRPVQRSAPAISRGGRSRR
ncbi:DUF3300 domain-containing protein [Pseudomonas citronellolis]|uniref:DUF3300 domain-containing protein n=1 Tax=Pseudomonas citronellolis TaxID=53408 RepID=UPI0023E45620|nr:DUF3300 domain-containing protein [Pseudomonas citronellolis]MDF3931024.1 DUF3300 domain-containing protein [Pseudomonas citronellolis]